jgi:hypothetical protein
MKITAVFLTCARSIFWGPTEKAVAEAASVARTASFMVKDLAEQSSVPKVETHAYQRESGSDDVFSLLS